MSKLIQGPGFLETPDPLALVLELFDRMDLGLSDDELLAVLPKALQRFQMATHPDRGGSSEKRLLAYQRLTKAIEALENPLTRKNQIRALQERRGIERAGQRTSAESSARAEQQLAGVQTALTDCRNELMKLEQHRRKMTARFLRLSSASVKGYHVRSLDRAKVLYTARIFVIRSAYGLSVAGAIESALQNRGSVQLPIIQSGEKPLPQAADQQRRSPKLTAQEEKKYAQQYASALRDVGALLSHHMSQCRALAIFPEKIELENGLLPASLTREKRPHRILGGISPAALAEKGGLVNDSISPVTKMNGSTVLDHVVPFVWHGAILASAPLMPLKLSAREDSLAGASGATEAEAYVRLAQEKSEDLAFERIDFAVA